MKKFTAMILVLLLIAAVAVPASACTPKLNPPDLPEIPDISDNVQIDASAAVDDWFEEHPIALPDETESEQTEPETAASESAYRPFTWWNWFCQVFVRGINVE